MVHTPEILTTGEMLHAALADLRARERRVGLVPTMGALHEGHLSLVDVIRPHVDDVICSIFVNPKQFGENEDLDHYPRQLEDDVAALSSRDVALVFAPPTSEIYPDDFQTTISVGQISQGLCGGARPGHFDGVATVVAKLLLMVLPDVAVFGEKDYQQLMVIRQMVRDLAIPVEILGAPIIRAVDGLALSSRNEYLSREERAKAALIYQTVQRSAELLADGGDCDEVLNHAIETLIKGGFDVDYFEVRDEKTLSPLPGNKVQAGTARLLVAARLGSTRLIDNLPV